MSKQTIKIILSDGSGSSFMDIPQFPTTFKGDIDISSNDLEAFNGLPNVLHGELYATLNNLGNLVGSPTVVHGDYDVSDSQLGSFKGVPKLIDGTLNASCNHELTEIDDVPDKCHRLDIFATGIKHLPHPKNVPFKEIAYYSVNFIPYEVAYEIQEKKIIYSEKLVVLEKSLLIKIRGEGEKESVKCGFCRWHRDDLCISCGHSR